MTVQENNLDGKLTTGISQEVLFELKPNAKKAVSQIWTKQGEQKGPELNMILACEKTESKPMLEKLVRSVPVVSAGPSKESELSTVTLTSEYEA